MIIQLEHCWLVNEEVIVTCVLTWNKVIILGKTTGWQLTNSPWQEHNVPILLLESICQIYWHWHQRNLQKIKTQNGEHIALLVLIWIVTFVLCSIWHKYCTYSLILNEKFFAKSTNFVKNMCRSLGQKYLI